MFKLAVDAEGSGFGVNVAASVGMMKDS